jgi:non-specific serine/threonine protein kinase
MERHQTSSAQESLVTETMPAGTNIDRPTPPAFRDPDWLGAPLPTQLTSFVGRQQEIAAVTELLRRLDVRLVTLTGPGGVGKTRLALRVASGMVEAFPDGVAFVSLAAISDPAHVASAIARAIEPAESGDRAPLQRLTSVLRTVHVLLVLDNFEQVIEAAPFVAELLAGCPGLSVLVTSRAPLHISGEYEFPVEPMPVPDPGNLPGVAELALYGAVDLFAQRAVAVRQDFAIQESNAAAIAEICARLDGIPLAIELAAARAKVLSPQAVLSRLEHRLTLLTGGSRDYPERLRAMRAAIAWSYGLLPTHERALFRRLAVFAGGCTIVAVESVAAPDASSQQALLDSLTSLVDSSLLIQKQGADGEPRFTMLETIREFGLELLAATGEIEETRRRHADWCLAISEEFYRENRRWMDPAKTISRLAPEHDNMRAALSWLDSIGHRADFARLAGAFFAYWYINGELREGISWLERTPIDAGEIPPVVRARALLGAGMIAHYATDDARAIPWLEASLALSREVDDRWSASFTLLILGIAAEDAGDYREAATRFSESLIHIRAEDDPVLTGLVLLHQGIIAWGEGDRDRAERLVNEALQTQQVAGELLYGGAESISFLGLLACERGQIQRSVDLQREGLTRHLEKGYVEILAVNLANVAVLALAAKRAGEAARLFGAAYGQREAIGNPFKLPELAVYDRAIATTKTVLPANEFTSAYAAGGAQSLTDAVVDAFAALDLVDGRTSSDTSTSPPRSAGEVAGLTERELEVLRLLVAGGTNRDIADALYVSPRTIQVHLANIFGKLDVHTRAAAVARAFDLGLN